MRTYMNISGLRCPFADHQFDSTDPGERGNVVLRTNENAQPLELSLYFSVAEMGGQNPPSQYRQGPRIGPI
jgi:hypothetical protein